MKRNYKILNCEYCGKEFTKTQYRFNRSIHHFCSIECRGMFDRKYNDYIKKEDCIEVFINSPKYGNKSCFIDLEDEAILKKYLLFLHKPNSNLDDDFYVYCKQRDDGKIFQLARVLLNCSAELVVDHINRNPLDNRKNNLRACTHSLNVYNRRIPKRNKTGIVGVYKEKNKYKAYISFKNKQITLGRFDDIAKAIHARKQAELQYYGEYLNA